MALLLNANDSVNRSYTITKPSPNHPLDVNGVGEIDNIFEGNIEQGGYSSGNPYPAQNRVRSDTMILVQPNVKYYMNFTGLADQFTIIQYTTNGTYSKDIGSYLNAGDPFVFSSAWKLKFVFRNSGNTNISPSDVSNIALSRGYKIPILTNQQTTNIYLGSTQTTRQIGKYIFDGSNIFTTQRTAYRNNTALFATTAMAGTGITNRPSMNNYFVAPSSGTNPQSLDYACSGFHPFDLYSSFYYLRVPYDVIGMTDINTDNEFITALNTWLSSLYNSGNPMIAYYALATPETAAVNEPLMKIGDYSDTLSNAASIPTTEGANSITVDTTVQPSEFTAIWTGWHDANVKEWDGSQWQ